MNSDGGGGSTTPDLSLDPGALNEIAEDARALRFGLSATAGLATSASLSAAADLRAADLASAGSLTTMANRFFRNTMDLVADCQTVEDGLGLSSTSHTELEADVVAQLHRTNQAMTEDPGPTEIVGMWGTSGGSDARI
ncbi:hypothetical protein ACFVUW_27010 [Streptomyces xiamenensis]|uniref:hypothetical protein n=1 Tax=Streptomyces xiamenensis TaxID=408015 RepID=UPI0036EB14B1